MNNFINKKLNNLDNRFWNRVLWYPILSGYLENSLQGVDEQGEILQLMDKALWVNLNKGVLSEHFTLKEAIKLDIWSQSNPKPDIPNSLVKQFKDEWGLEFIG